MDFDFEFEPDNNNRTRYAKYKYDNNYYTIATIIENNRIDVLNYIYDNNLYDINRVDDFTNTIMKLSIEESNLETFKWVDQKFTNKSNFNVQNIFNTKNYVEFMEYVIDNMYYEYINLDNIRITENQIQYCINNMHKLKLKYTSHMIERLVMNSCDLLDPIDILNFVLQASLDGKIDYNIWLDPVIVDRAAYDCLLWLYEKYKLNLLPFNHTINAVHNGKYYLDKIKWWVSKQDEFSIKCDLNLVGMPVDVFKYLFEEQNIINLVLDKDSLHSLLMYGQYNILEYLIEKKHTDELLELLNDNYIDECANSSTIEWIYSKHKKGLFPFKYSNDAFDYAVLYGNNLICEWFVDHYIQNKGELELLHTVESNDFDFSYTNVKTISYLLSIQDLIKINIQRVIDTAVSPDVLDYLYKNHNDEFCFTSSAIDNCYSYYTLKWWFNNAIESGGTIELKYTELCLDNAFKEQNFDRNSLINLWYENRFKFIPKFTKENLISFVNQDYDNRKHFLDFLNNNNNNDNNT
jgi:hypothetical protein